MPKFKSFANDKFWKSYNDLPTHMQELADKAFELFKNNSMNNQTLEPIARVAPK